MILIGKICDAIIAMSTLGIEALRYAQTEQGKAIIKQWQESHEEFQSGVRRVGAWFENRWNDLARITSEK